MSELRLNTAGQFATYRFIYASTGNTIYATINPKSVTVSVVKIGSTLTTIAGTTANFITVVDGIYTFVYSAGTCATPGECMFGFNEPQCLPFEMLHSVITVKDWDYRYSTAASNIDDVKIDTASCVVAIASVRANMGYASTEATILNNTTSTIVNITSVLTRIAEVKADTASTVVAIASVLANYAQASVLTAVKVETASMLAKIDIIDTVADTIKVDTASSLAKIDIIDTVVDGLPTDADVGVQVVSGLTTMDIAQASEIISVTGADVWSAQASVYASVGSMGELLAAAGGAGDPWITELPGTYTGIQAGALLSSMCINTASTVVAVASVLANYAQASVLAAVRTDVTSVVVAIASVRTNMGYASTEATILANTTSTIVNITSVLTRIAEVKMDTASTVVAIASVIVAVASVRANMGYASTETTILNNTTSTIVNITSVLTRIAEVKTDTASTVVAIASVLANYAQASTVTGVAQASALLAVKVETASMLAKIDILDTVADAIKVDTASTVVAIASVLANYAQASTVIGVAQASAIAAVVNAQVLDVLNVDTFAEPGQEAPAATTTIIKKLGYIFKFARNKLTATSTTVSIFADDAATVDQKSTVSDDGTTFTRGEIGTGP